MEVRWSSGSQNKYAALPTCNSSLQVPFWFWLIEGAGAKNIQSIGSRFCVWCHGFDLLCFDFGRSLLFHFCTCEGRSQHSVVDIQVHCPILGTHFPWKICPRNANKQRPFFFKRIFFHWGLSRRRPKVRENASKVWKYPSSLVPSEPKGFFV